MALRAGGAVGALSFGNESVFLIGYGPGDPRRTRVNQGELRLRAIVLEDNGERVALVSGDLWSASRAVLNFLGELLSANPHLGLRTDTVFFSGTHTHCSVGGIFPTEYYAHYAGSWPHDAGYKAAWARSLAMQLLAVIQRACNALQPAEVSFGEGTFQGHSINRSYPAYVKNQVPGSDLNPNAPESAQRAAVNPALKLVKFTSTDGTKVLGVWGTVNCHNIAFGKSVTKAHADFMGRASRDLEGENLATATPWVLCAGAIGDVDPQPAGLNRPQFIATRLMGQTASEPHMLTLANALRTAVQATLFSPGKQSITLKAHRSYPGVSGVTVNGKQLPRKPRVGNPVLAGSELGRGPCSEEGERLHTPDNGDAHWPKKSDHILMPLLNAALDQTPVIMPLSMVTLGDVAWLVGVPGEPTTRLAHAIEETVKARAGAAPVMVCGVNGDYTGYFVTEREYEAQQYEGASCIWGRYTERFLKQEYDRLAVVAAAALTPPMVPLMATRAMVAPVAVVKRAPKVVKEVVHKAPGLKQCGLEIVTLRSETPRAELELELGMHRVRARPLDVRELGPGRWKLSFFVDKRLLRYRGRLVTSDGVKGDWQKLAVVKAPAAKRA